MHHHSPKQASTGLIIIVLVIRTYSFTSAIQGLQTNAIAVISRNSHRLSPALRILQKLPELLFPNFNSLRRGSVCHPQHRPPEVERVRDVSQDPKEDERDKIERISENYRGCYYE